MYEAASKTKNISNTIASGKLVFFQPKLSINQPNDVYEQEADAVSDKVMRMKEPSSGTQFFSPQTIQRKCTHCEEEEKQTQRKESSNDTTTASAQTENYIGSLNDKGRSLDQNEKNFFEPRFGYDFSNVQLHTNSEANQSAKDVNALAYTHGNNIVFGSNQYQPNTASGKKLLAHELTHVVQQSKNISAKRIQRLSDSSFEASAGVDQGISNGTMTADSISGQSYTINCPSGNYSVKFSFLKAYKGVYPYRAASRDVKGVYVKIQSAVTYTGSGGTCAPMRLIQTVRKITKNASGNMESADWNDTTRNQRAGWGNASAPSRGWMTDRVNTATVPFYTSGPNGIEGSATTPATMYDSPGLWSTDSNAGMEFDTSAVCEDASHTRRILATVNWGFYIDSSGSISFRPATPAATCGNPQQVKDAAARWDAISGNTATGITF